MSTQQPTPDRRPDVWAAGDTYEPYVGRWSRLVAREFIGWLALPDDLRWLDVGCGTGAMTETIVARCSPNSVVGVDRSEKYLAYARARVSDPRVTFMIGDAQAQQLPGEGFRILDNINRLYTNYAGAAAVRRAWLDGNADLLLRYLRAHLRALGAPFLALLSSPILARAPRGDGHPVVVIPPFVSWWRFFGRLREAEDRAQVSGGADQWLGFVLYIVAFFFLPFELVYAQQHLNRLWSSAARRGAW